MKLSTKLEFFFILIAILVVTNFFTVSYFKSLQKADGAIIDASGRNRMLSQKMAFYAEQVLNGNDAAKTVLRETVVLYDISLYALKNGGVAPGIADDRILPSTIPTIIPDILRAEALWVDYKKNAEVIIKEPTFIENGTINPNVQTAMSYIEKNSSTMLDLNNQMVKSYVLMDDNKQSKLTFTLLVVLLLNLIVILSCWVVTHSILRPIKKLTKLANDITSGKFDTEMEESESEDEIGELTRSFVKMRDSIKELNKEKIN